MLRYFLLGLVLLVSAHAKEISISFDDAPREDTAYFTGKVRAKKLIQSLRDAEVARAAFYLNPLRMEKGESRERILAYAKAGHLLGNHTYDHGDLRKVGAKQFVASIEKAHAVLKTFAGFAPWFRYPYLARGDTQLERDFVYQALDRLGYRDAYITVDHSDWYMDVLFQDAVREGKKIDFGALERLYVEVLYDSVRFYDELAVRVLGRSPKHVILLHENDLNALFVGKLIQFLRTQGWRIISPESAYEDEIANRRPATFHHGDGRIAALAAEKNYSGPLRDRYQDRDTLRALFQDRRVFTTHAK
jgi:peptidoglycan/xylan/chitin deacetylase (PgdA/CDA1 family)